MRRSTRKRTQTTIGAASRVKRPRLEVDGHMYFTSAHQIFDQNTNLPGF